MRLASFLRRIRSADPILLAAVALAITIVTALQIHGGAYQAEFSSFPDEAAHFVTALFVHDYLTTWPPADPIPWAVDYYLHYPKVAIGHWPPGYYLLLAIWWLVFPPGRASALWFNSVMILAAVVLFVLLARRIRPGWPVLFFTALLLVTPIVQESYATTMADLPSLLAGLVALFCLTRFLESPGLRPFLALAAAIAAALAVKGTGAVLLPAPLLALAAGGARGRLPFRRIAFVGAAALAVIGGLYLILFRGSILTILRWGGMLGNMPWSIEQLPDLAGPAALAIAAVAAIPALRRREPAAAAAALILASVVITSFFVRAIREPRHWIVAVPAMYLLVLAAFAWIEEHRRRLAPLVLLPLLATFPYALFRQAPEGFRAVAAQLRIPPRSFVSSYLGWCEGPWIALVALSEADRPQNTVIRATKQIAATDWNLYNYKLLAHNRDDIERMLDESGADLVVLHNAPPGASSPSLPHHELLRESMRDNPAWPRCAAAIHVEAFCRARPPRFPRRPVRIDLRNRLGYSIEER